MSAPCGTYAGWNAHQKAGEAACGPCRIARNAYMRNYRAIRPGVRAADQYWNNTRKRALEVLADEYPIRFAAILAKIRESVQAG